MLFVAAPSALNTELALRQGIWPNARPGWPMCGVPDVPLRQPQVGLPSHHPAQTAKNLHFEIIQATIARPQGGERSNGSSTPLIWSCWPGCPSPLLAAYIREPVIVRYDPRDITEFRIFHKNKFICSPLDSDHETGFCPGPR